MFADSYTLHMEYLDVERYPKGNYPKERFELYNEKYRDIKIDLLICVGSDAVDPIKKNAESYILNLPTVSVDLDFSNYGYATDLRLNDHTAVLGLKFNIDKWLSTALSYFPATSSIYFISGSAALDSILMSVIREASNNVPQNIKKSFVTNISMDELLLKVRTLPVNTILFMLSFNADNKLVPYYNPEVIRLISKQTSAPIFHLSDLGIGEGSFGGYVLSFAKVGLLTGDVAVKILNGADPNSIKITEQEYYEYLFDWGELKRWNLVNSDLIPAGSRIMFEDISFVDKYKWVGGVVLLFLVLQTLLIATLIRLNRNQKLVTKRIIETESRYREFLHEDRSLRLGQLTASLSHELNQPLTAILSTAQAGINFINSNEATPDLLKQILQKIVENDKRGASILSSIRGMMKLEIREKEKTDINSLINEVIAVFQSEAIKHITQLNVNLSDGQVYVLADRIQIQQVLLNLIFNASHSMEKVSALNREITVSSSINNEDVIVSVRDNGLGISDAMKEKLFKPFITARKEGLGIGLAICRSIIEDHQGKIWAENIPDGGAEFSFSLKIIKDE